MAATNKCYQLLLIVLMAANGAALAQTPKKQGTNQSFYMAGTVRLDSLTRMIHRSSNFRLSINSSKVNGSTVIPFSAGRYTLSGILQTVRRQTGIYYQLVGGYVIIQDYAPRQPTRAAPGHLQRLRPPVTNSKPAKNKYATSTRDEPPTRSLQRTVLRITSLQSSTQLQLLFVPAAKPAQPRLNRTQYAAKPVENPTGDELAGNRWSIGLLWQVGVPTQSTNDYLTNVSGRRSWYKPLVPGAWAQMVWGSQQQHHLLVAVRPTQHYATGGHVVSIISGPGLPADTLLKQRTLRLQKTNAVQLSMLYQRPLSERWLLGLGAGINYQMAGLIRQQVNRLSTGELLADSVWRISAADTAPVLRRWVPVAHAELTWQRSALQLALAAELPVMSMIKSESGSLLPLQVLLALRWRFWQNK